MFYIQSSLHKNNKILKPLFLIKDPKSNIVLLFLEKCDMDLVHFLKKCKNENNLKKLMTNDDKIKYCSQITEGVFDINSKGYVHSDLKTSNILLKKDELTQK